MLLPRFLLLSLSLYVSRVRHRPTVECGPMCYAHGQSCVSSASETNITHVDTAP